MSQVYTQDRPINPNKQYLQQKQLQFKQKKLLHQYLKKQSITNQVLPCFKDHLAHIQNHKSKSNTHNKTKAQLYDQIKKKNIEKFGQKKQNQNNKNVQIKTKKIDPLKMTIQYKPKTAVIIQTNEYKLKSLNQGDKNNNESEAKKNTQNSHPFEQTAKQKYEKLLDILRKQKQQLAKDKQNFEKHKQKLQFKKNIEKQDTVPFINEIKKSIQQKRKIQKSHRQLCKSRKQNQQQQDNTNIIKKSKSRQNEKQSNKINLNQLQTKILQLQQQKQQIQDQVYKKKRQYIDDNDVICTKYSLQQVNQIPSFDVQCFKDFIDLKTIIPNKNQFYSIALKVFETGLNIKQAKIKLQVQNLDIIKQNQQHILNTIDYKRKYQGDIRITKYNNGWVQVWNPGVQRLMANKQLNYKIVWLRNGDIRQQWNDKKLQSYYSKNKQVVRIKFNTFQPIYYFIHLNQLEQYSPQKKIKTVMFKDQRIQTYSTDDDIMNGFAV